MKFTDTAIADVKIVEPTVFSDDRGHFFEDFNQRVFEAALGHAVGFVQDNQSHSRQGVLRGLHFQMPPMAQGKLIRVVGGEILDVAVDIRHGSPTFKQHVRVRLSAANRKQLWLPPGFAHGFLVLSDTADVAYKCTNYWDPDFERCIKWDDPALGIDWETVAPPILSDKDRGAAVLNASSIFR